MAAFTIAALSAAVYGRSLRFPFSFDDSLVISSNEFISSPTNLKGLFTSNYFLISGETTYRPVVTLSYYVDYIFWKLEPAGYHLTNITTHFLAGMAFYAFCVILLGGFSFPLIAAALFSVHPVNTGAVVSPGFREDLLAGFFYFSAVSLFMLSARAQRRRAFWLGGLCVVSYLLALFSKEMALSLPLVLLALVWTRAAGSDRPSSRSWVFWAALGAGTAFYVLTRFFLLSNPTAPGADYPGGSLGASILTMSRVFAAYARMLLLPIGLSADYAVTPSSIRDPWAFMSLAVLVAVLTLALWKARKWPLLSFCALWFFITLIPVSNFVPLQNIKADRYLYIPSAAFCLLLAIWGMKLTGAARGALRARLPAYPLSGVILCFAFLSGIRANDWRDPLTLWSRTLATNPASFRAHMNLGRAFTELQRYAEAIPHYEQARLLRPDEPMLYNNLGALYVRTGRPDLAVEEFRKALELSPTYHRAQTNLAISYARLGEVGKAEEALANAARARPIGASTYARMGGALLERGNLERAREYFETALKLSPTDAIAHDGLGRLLSRQGDIDGAIREHLAAVSSDPRSFVGYLNLGNAYRAKRLMAEAEQAYTRALELNPSYWKASFNLAGVYDETGQTDRAIQFYRSALHWAPHELVIYEKLGELLVRAGDFEEAVDLLEQATRLMPSRAEAFFLLAAAREASGDLPAAIKAYESGLALSPERVSVHSNLGELYLRIGATDKAIDTCRRALELNPRDPVAHANLGLALFKTGQLDDAIAHFKAALEIDPNCPKLHFDLAEAHRLKGDGAAAREHYRAFLESQQGDESLKHRAAATLEELER